MMMARIKKELTSKPDLAYFLSFGFLADICPPDLVMAILDKYGKISQRIRLFPAMAVVYFIIAMSLWREAPTEEVLRILVQNINKLGIEKNILDCPGKASISRARTKLGAEVMREIADNILRPIAPTDAKESWYKGMRLMALDGSTFDLPDEKENAEFYGYPSSSRGQTAFPQARVLSLVETGTHVVVAAQIAPYKKSEQELARLLIKRKKLDENMLLLADRGFYGYGLWSEFISTGVKLVWRVKMNLQLQVEKKLSDGSYLSTVYDSTNKKGCEPITVRVIEYKLNDKTKGKENNQIGQEMYRLLTNILDPNAAPAIDLAKLYHERWEIENLFGEFKSSLSFNSTIIRSKTPLLVEQELWGLIILHFAARQLMAKAAWKSNIDPDKLSFKNTVFVLRRRLPQLAAFPPSDAAQPA
jgi:hypothetical protein